MTQQISVNPYNVTPTAMIGEVFFNKLSERRKNAAYKFSESNIRLTAYSKWYFTFYLSNKAEVLGQDEKVGSIHIDQTQICCGSNVINIVGDLPQDVVDCFADCFQHSGMVYLVKGKVLPTACVRLSSTVGVLQGKRNSEIYKTEVSANHPLGVGQYAMFMIRASKQFPELKIVPSPALHGLKEDEPYQYVRSVGVLGDTADLQMIGDNLLFVWGVSQFPAEEASMYLDVFHSLPTVNDMLAISTGRQSSYIQKGKDGMIPTTEALVKGGFPVIHSGSNPGNLVLLNVHGLTKEKPVNPDPATAEVHRP